MNKVTEIKRLARQVLPFGALAGATAALVTMSHNLKKAYQGTTFHAPASQALRFAGEERFGESWTFLIVNGEHDLRVLITLAICNPADTSYLSETTAAYLSFSCWHRGSGWQLVDRYPLHQFHASDEHGEVRLGPFQDPRCFFKETPRDGLTMVELAGDLERETFLSNNYPGQLKDISWDLRFRFEGNWYPDAFIDQVHGAHRVLKPAHSSFSYRAAEMQGGLKINDSYFDFNPDKGHSNQAFLLHRWGMPPGASGTAVTCVAHGPGKTDGERGPWAFFSTLFQGAGKPHRDQKAELYSLLFSTHQEDTSDFMRNNPMGREMVRARWSEGDRRDAGKASLPRLLARGHGEHYNWRAEIIPEMSSGLDLVFPSPNGECIRQLWCPGSRMELLREKRRWPGRSSSVPVDAADLPADFFLERSGGDWWDQVADMIEIPIDLSTF